MNREIMEIAGAIIALVLGLVLTLFEIGLFLMASLIAYAATLSGNTAVMVLFGVACCCRGAYLWFVSARIYVMNPTPQGGGL